MAPGDSLRLSLSKHGFLCLIFTPPAAAQGTGREHQALPAAKRPLGGGGSPAWLRGRVWGSVSLPGLGGSVGSEPCAVSPAHLPLGHGQPGSPCFPHQVAGRDLVPTPWLWEQAQAVLELSAALQAS